MLSLSLFTPLWSSLADNDGWKIRSICSLQKMQPNGFSERNTPKQCYRHACFQPDSSLIKINKKTPTDFSREITSYSGIVGLSYTEQTRSGFILKLLI